MVQLRSAAWLLCLLALPAVADEAALIAVVRSDQPLAARAAACAELGRVGTSACVPALAALLNDVAIGYPARFALQAIPAPEAGAALRAALDGATGPTRLGIIDSLGRRGESEAVPALADLLRGPDGEAAVAAALALGHLAGPAATAALRAARIDAPEALRPAIAAGLLDCAAELARTEPLGAAAIYVSLLDPALPEHLRVAAWRGRIVAMGEQAPELLITGLAGDDAAAQQACLSLAISLAGPAVTAALCTALPRLAADRCAALLEALGDRGDPAALPAVLDQLDAAHEAVRLAALGALAELGDESVVGTLAARAGASRGDEQRAAREALARLRRGPIDETLLALLRTAEPSVQVQLAGALADRRSTPAVPALLDLARGRGPAAAASLAALAQLGGDADAAALTDILTAAGDETRDAAEAALAAVIARSGGRAAVGQPVLAALPGAAPEARAALLRLAGALGTEPGFAALREHLTHADEATREVALTTLAESIGVDGLDELLRLAREYPEPFGRVLALRGYWRLVGLAGERPATERLALIEAGLAAATRPDERRMGLSHLARCHLPAALALADRLGAEEAIREEAELAAIQIATALLGSEPAAARAALERLAAAGVDERVRAVAAEALRVMRERETYVADWVVSPAYRRAGVECQGLFDLPFGPEAGEAVAWRPAGRPADPLLYWQVDLADAVGGNHCVVYLRTRIHVPTAQRVRLDLGVDDGVKLWVNGELVHANNAVRGLTPDQDQAAAALRAGWNDLLAKITQHTAGCGLTLRVRTPDGAPVEGLRAEPDGG